MTNPVIPAQAVEAAAKAIYHTSGRSRQMPFSAAKAACEAEAREVLEAAAPYMLETGKGKGPIVVPVPRSAVTNLYRTRT